MMEAADSIHWYWMDEDEFVGFSIDELIEAKSLTAYSLLVFDGCIRIRLV